jgi:hypothetical protein
MIQLVLIAIIILTTVLHLWWQPLRVEGFQVHGMPPATAMAPARPLPEDDPLDLPWIASWSDADRAARYGQNCRVTYTEAGPCNTMIQTVSASCESGMPHTRAGDRIILPESIQLPDREGILRHELIHILQHRHPDNWLAFYRRNWSFTFASAAPQGMPQDIQAARRSNPDTWDVRSGGPWACWMNRWWPVAVYRDPADPQLRDAQTVWWDSASGEVLREPPADWTAFFGRPSQDEHPHELAAVMLAGSDTASEAGRRLQNWWRSEGRRSQVDADSVCPL